MSVDDYLVPVGVAVQLRQAQGFTNKKVRLRHPRS